MADVSPRAAFHRIDRGVDRMNQHIDQWSLDHTWAAALVYGLIMFVAITWLFPTGRVLPNGVAAALVVLAMGWLWNRDEMRYRILRRMDRRTERLSAVGQPR